MIEITIIYGFGVISRLDFRDDIVKKGSDLLSGGHMGEIKEVRTTPPSSLLKRTYIGAGECLAALVDAPVAGEVLEGLLHLPDGEKLAYLDLLYIVCPEYLHVLLRHRLLHCLRQHSGSCRPPPSP